MTIEENNIMQDWLLFKKLLVSSRKVFQNRDQGSQFQKLDFVDVQLTTYAMSTIKNLKRLDKSLE